MDDYICIPVYFDTATTKLMSNLNIKSSMEAYVVHDVAFFTLGVIVPMFDGETEYLRITVGNDIFLSPYTVEEIPDMVDESMDNLFQSNN